MKRQLQKRCLTVSLLLATTISQMGQLAANPVPLVPQIGAQEKINFDWTREKWTGDEKVFTAIRNAIDAQVRSGKNLRPLLDDYKRAALAKPLDAQSQFRWAYTAFVIYNNRWQSGKNERDVLQGIREAMGKPKSPQSAEYARVRAFMNEWDDSGNRFVRKCVFRLLARNPKDDLIRYEFAFSMSRTSNPIEDQDLAYKWAKEYLAKFPNKPQAYYEMGCILGSRFDRFHTMRMIQEAIGYLKKCQKMLPKDHFYVGIIQKRIVYLNEGIEIFRKSGRLKE